ncbi:arylesterase [Palleronia caenipelagi]|nr:arylesterase [Palleronia caenipelagi]
MKFPFCFRAYGVQSVWLKVAAIICLTFPAAAEVSVLALGDSLTQGYGLPPDQGFVPQLEEWLTAQGAEVSLTNGGVSGDTTAGGLSRVAWSLTPGTDVMLVALGGNDLLRGIDPDVARANLDGILATADAEGVAVLLIGMSAPGNYGADYKVRFDRMYPDLAEKWGVPLVTDFLGALRDAGATDDSLRDYVQPDGIHPSAVGVELIVNAVGPEVLALVEATGNVNPD